MAIIAFSCKGDQTWRTMLPFDSKDIYDNGKSRFLGDGLQRFPDYMRRLCDFRQMDFEAAFDQLLTLVSLDPKEV